MSGLYPARIRLPTTDSHPSGKSFEPVWKLHQEIALISVKAEEILFREVVESIGGKAYLRGEKDLKVDTLFCDPLV